jgi:hypothetical protein
MRDEPHFVHWGNFTTDVHRARHRLSYACIGNNGIGLVSTAVGVRLAETDFYLITRIDDRANRQSSRRRGDARASGGEASSGTSFACAQDRRVGGNCESKQLVTGALVPPHHVPQTVRDLAVLGAALGEFAGNVGTDIARTSLGGVEGETMLGAEERLRLEILGLCG